METFVHPQKQTPESQHHLQTLDDACGMQSSGQAHVGCILTSDQKGSLSQLKKICLDHNYDLSNPDHYMDDAALL